MMKVLVPVDGSESSMQAAEYALKTVTADPSVDVTLASVPWRYESAYFADAMYEAEKVNKDFIILFGERLKKVKKLFDDAGVPVKAELLSEGDPAKIVTYYVEKKGFDEVILGSRDLSSIKGIVLGGVAYKVLSDVKVPVTVVMPDINIGRLKEGSLVKVLVAVDGSDNSIRVAEYVLKMSRANPAVKVTLLSVACHYDAAYFADTWVGEDIPNKKCLEESTKVLTRAKAVFDHAGVPAKSELLMGDPGTRIISYIENKDIDRVIMGSRGLNPFIGMVLGSVAYKVLNSVKVPVTVIK